MMEKLKISILFCIILLFRLSFVFADDDKGAKKQIEELLLSSQRELNNDSHAVAILHAEEALDYAEKANLGIEKAKVYLQLARIKKNTSDYDKADFYINKGRQIIDAYLLKNKKDKEAIKVKIGIESQFGSISYRYDKISESIDAYTNALNYSKLLVNLAPTSLDNKEGLANAKYDLAYIYWVSGDFETALLHYKQALNDYQKLHEKFPNNESYYRIIGRINNGIGAIHWGFGDYNLALENYLLALEVMDESVNLEGKVLVLNNIGLVYYDWDKSDKALEYFFKAKELGEKIGYNNAYTYNNLGKVMESRENYEEAITYYQTSLEKYKEVDRKNGICVALNCIARVYHKQKKYDEALNYYQESIDISSKSERLQWLAKAYTGIANLYFEIKNFAEAKDYAFKALKISEKEGYKEFSKESHYSLFKVYNSIGKTDLALDHYIKYTEVKDSIFSENSMKQLTEMRTKYESEQKEAENKLLQIAVQRQQLIVFGVLIGLLLVIALAYIFFRGRQKEKRAKKILEKQNHEIQKQKEEIAAQADYLFKANDQISNQNLEIQKQKERIESAYDKLKKLDEFKNRMTGMIVHDLKNPLNTIINLSDLTLHEKLNQKANSNLKFIFQAGRQMLNLVMNILDVERFEDAKINLNTAFYNINATIEGAMDQMQFSCLQKNIKLKKILHDDYVVNIDEQLIGRVLVNLLSNAVKFSLNNSFVEIGTNKVTDEKQIEIFVRDFGAGIPKDKIHVIFEKYSQVKAVNAGSTPSTGLGLTFCKMAVEAHGGEISVSSVENEETIFKIQLPYERIVGDKKDAESKENHLEVDEKTDLLSAEDKEVIAQYAISLKEVNVYEISKIRKIFIELEQIDAPNIKTWANDVMNAASACNEEKYLELLEISS